jgi:chemotaxis protein MotB
MATFETKKVAEAIGSLEGALGVLEEGRHSEPVPPNPIQATPIEADSDSPTAVNVLSSLITEFKELDQLGKGPSIKLEEAEDGFRITIPDGVLFEPGSAVIKDDRAMLLLQRIGNEFAKMPNSVGLDVEGHTDDAKYNTPNYDNWNLSVDRALSVAEVMLENGAPRDRTRVSGRGEFDPVASNKTEEGRALNRRVVLHFYSLDSKQNQKAKDATSSVVQTDS